MLEAFLAKAREAGGPELAHARARAHAPGGSQELSGVVVANARGLVFVVEDLFDAGTATLIPRETLRSVSRRDELWGAELTVNTSQGAWVFSRIEPGAVAPLLSALGLELAAEDVRAQAPEAASSPTTEREVAEPIEAAPTATNTVVSDDHETSPLSTNDTFAPAEFLSLQQQTPSAEHFPVPAKRPPAPAAKQRATRIVLVALAIAAVSVAATIVVTVVPSPSTSPPEVGLDEPVVEIAADPQPGLRTGKAIYTSTESIDVFFHGFPGNAQDWITVVEHDAAENSYDEWHYLDRRRAGMLSFRPRSPGTYEVRAFFDWPEGGYTVQRRLTVRVAD